ncbi:MAG: hypothetical protein WD847_16580 [Pirellulales bacterium]
MVRVAHNSRILQYSMRSMLLLITIVGVVLGDYVNDVRRQRAAVAELDELGGWCFYEYEWDDQRDLPKQAVSGPPGPNWLIKVLGVDMFHPVVAVTFVDAEVDDEDLVLLRSLPRVRNLNLRFANVTDVGLSKIALLKRLEVLNVSQTHISDAGLLHIQALKELRSVDLCGTKVTDAGLQNLEALSKLEKVYLENSGVTDEGFHRLQRARPGVRRHRY